MRGVCDIVITKDILNRVNRSCLNCIAPIMLYGITSGENFSHQF
jgi:hypothetical protein